MLIRNVVLLHCFIHVVIVSPFLEDPMHDKTLTLNFKMSRARQKIYGTNRINNLRVLNHLVTTSFEQSTYKYNYPKYLLNRPQSCEDIIGQVFNDDKSSRHALTIVVLDWYRAPKRPTSLPILSVFGVLVPHNKYTNEGAYFYGRGHHKRCTLYTASRVFGSNMEAKIRSLIERGGCLKLHENP